MESYGSLFSAELVSQNVVKAKAVKTTFGPAIVGSGIYPLFNPDSVRIEQAAGGFSTVVEISANHCLKVFDKAVEHPWELALNSYKILDLLNSSPDSFNSELLNSLIGTDNLTYDFFAKDFKPVSLKIVNPHKLEIVYEANVTREFIQLNPPVLFPSPFEEIPDPIGPISEFGQPVLPVQYAAAGSFAMPSARGAEPAFKCYMAYPQSTPISTRSLPITMERNPGLSVYRPSDIPDLTGRPDANGVIGRLRFKITCPYTYDADDLLRRVDVYAVMNKATLEVLNEDDDIARLYDAGVFGHEGDLLTNAFLLHSRVHLTPTISVAGLSSAAVPPAEFEDFDSVVFHVNENGTDRQAMAIAINLKPGCEGIIEDVPHFIGVSNFGVITDEFRIERLFKYKWRTGGFMRQYPLTQPIEVQRNSHVEEATLHGRLMIDSLNIVSVEIEANSGEDVIKVGGSSSVHTDYLELADGTRTYQPDADHVNFGNPRVMPWSFMAMIRPNEILPTEPLLRQFQVEASHDAYQYIARPFARIHNGWADVSYTRVQAVTNQAFMLGTFASVFI